MHLYVCKLITANDMRSLIILRKQTLASWLCTPNLSKQKIPKHIEDMARCFHFTTSKLNPDAFCCTTPRNRLLHGTRKRSNLGAVIFMLFSNYLYEVSQVLSFLQAYIHLTFIMKELNIYMPATSAM